MKILFSDKEILVWFLERILNKKINSIVIKDKKNNKDVDENYIINLVKQELVNNSRYVKSKIVDLLIRTDNEIIDIEYNNYFKEEEKRRNITYYKKMLYNKGNKKLINKYKHLIMFDRNLEELKKLSEGDRIMEKIYNKVKEINDEDAIYNYMSIEEDDRKMLLTKLDNAMEKGIARGIDIGFESGKIETLNDTALSLLKNDIPINIIKDVTGYSEEYIQSLKC